MGYYRLLSRMCIAAVTEGVVASRTKRWRKYGCGGVCYHTLCGKIACHPALIFANSFFLRASVHHRLRFSRNHVSLLLRRYSVPSSTLVRCVCTRPPACPSVRPAPVPLYVSWQQSEVVARTKDAASQVSVRCGGNHFSQENRHKHACRVASLLLPEEGGK